jgi:aminopeptidase N
VINQVRSSMGDTAFWSAVRSYVRTYANQLSHTKTLLKFLDDHTKRDVQSIYRVYFPSLYPS